jgi:hypothetical protein
MMTRYIYIVANANTFVSMGAYDSYYDAYIMGRMYTNDRFVILRYLLGDACTETIDVVYESKSVGGHIPIN